MKTATPPREAEAAAQPDNQRLLLLVVGLLIAGFLVFFPTKQLIDQRGRIHRLEARLSVLTTENERLADEVARLEDPEELELLARERLGMVRPGEQVYLMVPSDDPTEPRPEVAVAEPRLWQRLWTSFVDLIRGQGR